MQDLISILAKLETITTLLRQLLRQNAPYAPNYRYPLAAYWTFDWTTIGAEIIRRDDKGATQVLWGGYLWTRRNDAGRQYGKAIWFSRIDSGSDRDDLTYIRLITFKNSAEPDPMRIEHRSRPATGDVAKSAELVQSDAEALVQSSAEATSSNPSAQWLDAARQAATLSELDTCLYNADPTWWKEPINVTKIRNRIAAPIGTPLPVVVAALLALRQQYPIALAAGDATPQSAMAQAIAVARRTVSTATGVDSHA
ncbi:MAG: single-stranded DNA-binding protein [Anaerolineae bacterium]|nr:single-stranded DNA-binding protein [Anaerolineae bacterium]MCO5193051.1 single-stranded DNA-binding protein [Anaerolineae bacterium]MCO5205654.1 single-stranded DNA-binding protein [Anaerolineae bacterium]